MKIYTSYFYQVRFFKENMVPISTAIYDPKWYHDYHNQAYVFKDKRGIINGIKIQAFIPGIECQDLCGGPDKCDTRDPNTCKFLTTYKNQLDSLNHKKVIKYLYDVTKATGVKNPVVVLLFHETPDKQCSERTAVQKWFKSHGDHVEELQYPINEHY